MADRAPSAISVTTASTWRTVRPGHAIAGAMAIAPTVAAIAPLGLAPLFTLLVVVAGILHLVHGRGWPRLSYRPIVLAAVFVAWAAATFAWTVAPAETLRFIPRLGINLAAMLALVAIARAMPDAERQIIDRWLIVGFLIGAVLFAIEALTEGVLVSSLRRDVLQDDWSFQYGSLARGAAFFGIFGLLAALAARRRHGITAALAFLTLDLGVASLAHGYKAVLGAAIGVGVAAGIYILRRRFLPVVGAAVVALVLTAPLQPMILDSVHGPWATSDNASITHRLLIWRFVEEKIAERPIQGWGLNSSRALPGGKDGPTRGLEMLPLHPHNGPLQLWLELGAIGALLAALGLGMAALSLAKLFPDRAELGLAAGSLATAIAVGAVGYGLWQGWWLATIWLAATLIAALAPGDELQISSPDRP